MIEIDLQVTEFIVSASRNTNDRFANERKTKDLSDSPADHNPYASPESPEPLSRPKRSRFALTAVASLNYVMGTISLTCGGCYTSLFIPEGPPRNPGVTLVGLVIGLGFIFLSLPPFLAGFGIQRRKQWGRILSLILGVLGGILAVLFGVLAVSEFLSSRPPGPFMIVLSISILYGGYTTFVMVILLRPKYAAEFCAPSPSEGE